MKSFLLLAALLCCPLMLNACRINAPVDPNTGELTGRCVPDNSSAAKRYVSPTK